jgi:hypothetical protein
MEIRPVVADLFHSDGQTDMTKTTVAFRNFTNTSEDKTINSIACVHLVKGNCRIDLCKPQNTFPRKLTLSRESTQNKNAKVCNYVPGRGFSCIRPGNYEMVLCSII